MSNKHTARCVMCRKLDRVEGIAPKGIQYLCPKCLKKVKEEINKRNKKIQ